MAAGLVQASYAGLMATVLAVLLISRVSFGWILTLTTLFTRSISTLG